MGTEGLYPMQVSLPPEPGRTLGRWVIALLSFLAARAYISKLIDLTTAQIWLWFCRLEV